MEWDISKVRIYKDFVVKTYHSEDTWQFLHGNFNSPHCASPSWTVDEYRKIAKTNYASLPSQSLRVLVPAYWVLLRPQRRISCWDSPVWRQEKPAILGGNTYLFLIVPVWLFYFVSGSFQAFYTKRMYSSQTISFFFSLNCFCLHKTSCLLLNMHAVMPRDNSSSVCSKGSALQCIFIGSKCSGYYIITWFCKLGMSILKTFTTIAQPYWIYESYHSSPLPLLEPLLRPSWL